MENIRNFLETSTVHGISYISTTKKYVKVFWILVVIGGFTGAGVLIYNSFQSWNESPVKTTIETHPISKITFPKVTVCPPKNTYTDLNYDLMMTENMTLDNDIRNELANFAVELLYDDMHDSIMTNMRKLEENDRYYNWYHGYTLMKLPYIHSYSGCLYYYLDTSATSGTIFTQHFGGKFDADKVDTDLRYIVTVYRPDSVTNNPNVTLHFTVEKLSLKDLSSGKDILDGTAIVHMDEDTTYGSKNNTPPTRSWYYIQFQREALPADVRKQKLKMMPGFRFTWHYSGMKVGPWNKYGNKAFVRDGFKNIKNFVKLRRG